MGDASAVGLPVAVQVASLSYRDETVLNVMRQVERAADFSTA